MPAARNILVKYNNNNDPYTLNNASNNIGRQGEQNAHLQSFLNTNYSTPLVKKQQILQQLRPSEPSLYRPRNSTARARLSRLNSNRSKDLLLNSYTNRRIAGRRYAYDFQANLATRRNIAKQAALAAARRPAPQPLNITSRWLRNQKLMQQFRQAGAQVYSPRFEHLYANQPEYLYANQPEQKLSFWNKTKKFFKGVGKRVSRSLKYNAPTKKKLYELNTLINLARSPAVKQRLQAKKEALKKNTWYTK